MVYRRIILMTIAILLLAAPAIVFSADTKYVDVEAEVPTENGLSIGITKIEGENITPDQSKVDFGKLTFDADSNIFRASCHYAVDVGVTSNAADWSVTHTVNNSVTRVGGTENLDDSINVSFMRKDYDSGAETVIDKYSLTDSNNKSFAKSGFAAGEYIRIYYGIANGSDDNPGVTSVGVSQPAGVYTGQIKLTLSP